MDSKNKPSWNFWEKGSKKYSFENPYSGINGNLSMAIYWAKRVKKFNNFKTICFKRNNGRKVYEI